MSLTLGLNRRVSRFSVAVFLALDGFRCSERFVLGLEEKSEEGVNERMFGKAVPNCSNSRTW